MLLYACAHVLQMLKGYIWPSALEVEAEEEAEVEQEEAEVEQEPEPEPVKRYNLRERKPVDYQEE